MTRTPAQCDAARQLVAYLDAIRVHLSVHPVAVPVSVDVDGWGGKITALLDTVGLAQAAAALLCWADTLTDVTGHAWRAPGADSVHLSVTGQTATGVTVRVYDGVAYDQATFPDLQPGDRRGLGLAELRTWATGRTGTPASGGAAA